VKKGAESPSLLLDAILQKKNGLQPFFEKNREGREKKLKSLEG